MSRKYSSYLLVILVLGVVIYLYQHFRSAPDVTFEALPLTDLKGQPASLPTNGKPVVVMFGASWCGPCRKELDVISRIGDRYMHDVNIVFITDEDLPTAEGLQGLTASFVKVLKLNKPFSDLGIYSIPTSYLLNAKGELVEKHTGYIQWDDLSARAHQRKLMGLPEEAPDSL